MPFIGIEKGIVMRGFSSTSQDKQEALAFSVRDLASPKIPVLIEVKFDNEGHSHFQLNKPEYTLFPEEQEILLLDGLRFTVESVDKNASEILNG